MQGQRWGRLTVVKSVRNASGRMTWLCICDCGNQTTVYGQGLRRGTTRSCGCYAEEWRRITPLKHGACTGGKRSAEYEAWSRIKKRCHDPNDKDWPRYGGRGILVCDEWRASFAQFFADMGPLPSPSHSIDRIDNALGYFPANCRWATPRQQADNRRTNKLNHELAAQVRALLKAGRRQKDIAAIFNVSPAAICDIAGGRTWRAELRA